MSNPNVFLPVPFTRDPVPYPNFAKPAEISFFSTDSQNGLHFDKSQLSSYSPPDSIGSLNLDLNDGLGQFIEQRSRRPGCLDNLLRWILESHQICGNRNRKSLKEIVHGADFVCWRGLLTKLAATPYEDRENWMVGAVRFKNVVFLMAFETEQEKEKRENMSEKDKRMTYWGHRFEKYVTKPFLDQGKSISSDQSENTSDQKSIVDCNEQYCVVFRTKISQSHGSDQSSQYRLLYGAEVDCVDDHGQYIELKTSRVIDGWRQERNFKRFKLMKWWLQSYLAGIDRIVCGYRDDAGMIKHLTPYDVQEMPRSAAGGVGERPYWSGAVCMSFLLDFLAFVARNTPTAPNEDCVGEIAVFEFFPQSRQIRIANNHGLTSDLVLPDWFVADFGKV